MIISMPPQSTLSFSKSGQTLFTPKEVRQLMRVEFDRGQRYGFPVACFLILVDRLDDLSTVHGWEVKEEILLAMVELLKSETRASDFLGCLDGDRILAVVPHTSAESARFLAERLLKGTRELAFGSGSQSLRVSLSIGMSHSEQDDPISYETLIRVAEEGLLVAEAGGGDRCIETELYQLYEKHYGGRSVAPGAPVKSFGSGPLALVEAGEDLEAAATRLADDLVEQALAEIRAERDQLREELADTKLHLQTDSSAPDPGFQSEIDQLRRRLSKVTKSLGLTEQELTRLRVLKDVDPGLSSVYRDVQGLSMEDAHAELKRELMQNIFQANVNLRKEAG
ncbi:MAG: diguanylate cyclase (GGDEF)-like protein [Chlamydiales bacterium]|jgi:diguanylate cyclase (GGDEF)-like protein